MEALQHLQIVIVGNLYLVRGGRSRKKLALNRTEDLNPY